MKRIVQALLEKCANILIRMRADSGYGKPWLYGIGEQLGVEYSIGIGMNNVLKRNTEELLQKAVDQYEETSDAHGSSPALTTRPAPGSSRGGSSSSVKPTPRALTRIIHEGEA